ncbi:glycosyltransferase family 4 protein [bacterium]|nr:MAG: glycosyltransferase family 4 protein [bacterium]
MSRTICFVSDFFISDKKATITGPMVQTYLIGSELKKRGWDVHYIAYSKEGKDNFFESYEGMTVHWIRHRPFLPLLQYRKIRKVLTAINADYHYQRGRDILTGFVARYCKKNHKTFAWASAGESGVERGKYQRQLRKKNRPFIKKTVLWCEAKINDVICEYGIENASRIIVQTEYQKNRLKETFGLDSVVIKSGHPVPEPVERSAPLKILWIGSIKAVKRPELFIELAESCRNLECEFWMAGQFVDSRLKSFLLQKMQHMNNLKYLGAVPFHESQALISKAHVLVNTTDNGYEGLPNAFVQAWLAGTVTLSLHSDPDGVIEKYGLGAKVESITAMKNELEKIVENVDYWKSMSDNARKFGVDNFSIEEITYKLIDVMNSHLAKLIQN